MRITIQELNVSHSRESDYDTAVDLVHFSEERVAYVLRLPSGAHMNLERTVLHTSGSYLEPDFDLLEESGELRYEQHPSDEPASETTYHYGELQPLFRMRSLTVEDWVRLREAGYEDDFDALMFMQADEVAPSSMAPEESRELLFRAVQALGLRKGQSFDAQELGPAFARWAQEVDALAWQLSGENLKARIDSRSSQALLRLQEWLRSR